MHASNTLNVPTTAVSNCAERVNVKLFLLSCRLIFLAFGDFSRYVCICCALNWLHFKGLCSTFAWPCPHIGVRKRGDAVRHWIRYERPTQNLSRKPNPKLRFSPNPSVSIRQRKLSNRNNTCVNLYISANLQWTRPVKKENKRAL